MPDCLVCGSGVPGDSRWRGALFQCPACGFVFADVRLSAEEHRALYQREYFFDHEYADYTRSKVALQQNFRRRIATLSRFCDSGRLYEIGAAYGFFLELAQGHWQVAGIDVAEEASAYARHHLGLDVRCGDFLETPLDTGGYDLFCLWDTIEHVQHPDRYLQKIACHLRSGGYVALTTGDIGSWAARLQGRRWRLVHPPTHLHYFSTYTMARLLDCYGFDVVHVSHPGFYRSLEEMMRWFLLLFGQCGSNIYDKIRNVEWMKKGISINLFDIMFVVGRKR